MRGFYDEKLNQKCFKAKALRLLTIGYFIRQNSIMNIIFRHAVHKYDECVIAYILLPDKHMFGFNSLNDPADLTSQSEDDLIKMNHWH